MKSCPWPCLELASLRLCSFNLVETKYHPNMDKSKSQSIQSLLEIKFGSLMCQTTVQFEIHLNQVWINRDPPVRPWSLNCKCWRAKTLFLPSHDELMWTLLVKLITTELYAPVAILMPTIVLDLFRTRSGRRMAMYLSREMLHMCIMEEVHIMTSLTCQISQTIKPNGQ